MIYRAVILRPGQRIVCACATCGKSLRDEPRPMADLGGPAFVYHHERCAVNGEVAVAVAKAACMGA